MGQPTPPQYSRDGRWWWDGSQWTAVTADWPPKLDEAPPTPPPAPLAPRASLLSRVRLPRVPLRFLLAAGVVVAVLLAGTGIVWAVQHRPLPAPAPTPPPVGATATPSPSPSSSLPPEKYPYRYMTGVTVSEILGVLEGEGFTCDSPRQERDLGLARWPCHRQTESATSFVTIEARNETEVWNLDAEVVGSGQKPALDETQTLFDSLAGLPLKQQPDLAAQARAWVKAHADSDGYTMFSQITYSSLPGDQSFYLEMNAGFKR